MSWLSSIMQCSHLNRLPLQGGGMFQQGVGNSFSAGNRSPQQWQLYRLRKGFTRRCLHCSRAMLTTGAAGGALREVAIRTSVGVDKDKKGEGGGRANTDEISPTAPRHHQLAINHRKWPVCRKGNAIAPTGTSRPSRCNALHSPSLQCVSAAGKSRSRRHTTSRQPPPVGS